MVALDDNNAVLDRTAGTAFVFQALGYLFQVIFAFHESRNGGHGFAFTALLFPSNTDDSISLHSALGFYLLAFACAASGRFPAFRAYPSRFSGIYKLGVVCH